MATLSEVGISGIALYVPRHAVCQKDLEEHDGVSPGKYTVGLGQNMMSIVKDNEDVVSMALTVVQRLVDRYELSYCDIGRLEVGTETVLDKSKSIKSSLMQLFEASGNSDVEGLDCVNACYGSTAALFNTVAWMESSAWDGRYGVVVASDVAVYAPGPARPTGGAGSVALLIARGRNCPLRFEIGMRASAFGNSYDFYKPSVASEYPTVNGQETVNCFVSAMDRCYAAFRTRAERIEGKRFTLETDVDYFVCHAPFNKMVRRSIARLLYNDFMDIPGTENDSRYATVQQYRSLDRRVSQADREATRAFVSLASPLYDAKCEPAAWLARETGNSYTASLYSSLAALIFQKKSALVGSRIVLFAFGSRFASSLFSMRVVGPIERLADSLADLKDQLNSRVLIGAAQYEDIMRRRETDYGRFDYNPKSQYTDLLPGTFYLASVGKHGQRVYKRAGAETGTLLASPRKL